jgi:hypothetical protein
MPYYWDREPQRAVSFSVTLSSASHGDFVIMPSTAPWNESPSSP